MTKRRGRYEGAVFQRRDGRWVGEISFGSDATGKRKRRYVYAKSKKEALDKLSALRNKAAASGLVDPTRMKLGVLLDSWLEQTVKTTLKANTYQSYEITARVHIKPRFIGGMRLSQIRPDTIQALYTEMKKDKVSARTIKNVHLVLNRALGQAKRWHYIASNPCTDVETPVRRRRKMKSWSPEHAAAFLAAAQQDRLWALYVLAIDSGLRQGELFALQWSDVELERAEIQVQRSMVEIKGKHTEDVPKEEDSVRLVAIGKASVEALKIHQRSMLAEGNRAAKYVFCDSEGGPLRKSNMRRRSFKPLLELAGVPPIRFHDLRHTCATILLSEGVHPKIVQERLGHSDVRITLQTYSHVLPHLQREAADKLDAALSRSKK